MTIPVKLNYIDKHVFVSNHQQFYSGSRKIIECLHFSISLFIDKLHKLPFLLKPQLYLYGTIWAKAIGSHFFLVFSWPIISWGNQNRCILFLVITLQYKPMVYSSKSFLD